MTSQTRTPSRPPTLVEPRLDDVRRAVARRSFCTLATTSPAGHPHVAAVVYAAEDLTLWVTTLRTSRKARNLVANPRAAVCIPVRRLPVGPPSSVQFQATAEVLDVDDPQVLDRLARGGLRTVTAHGELELPGACVLRIAPGRRIATYGLGMPLRRLLRDPLHAGATLELAPDEEAA